MTTDIDEALDMIREGYSTHYIAHQLGTTRSVLQRQMLAHGICIPGIRAQTLFPPRSLHAVAALFGVNRSTVTQWVKTKRLVALRERRIPSRPRYTRLAFVVSEFAILDFLALRDLWMTYDPTRITDPYIREEALRLRAEAGGDWVLLADYARKRGYGVHTGQWWVRNGHIPAVQHGRRYYVWSADLARFDPAQLPAGWSRKARQ